MSNKSEYYNSARLRAENAHYSIAFGERSNGKTFDFLKLGLELNAADGETQIAFIRRFSEDFVGENSSRHAYDSLMCDGDGKNRISQIYKGKYDAIEYYAGKFYLGKKDPETGKTVRSDRVVAIAFALNLEEHYKGSSFPQIRMIFFDEFISRTAYLRDEFIRFQNLLSTIIRRRSGIHIYMAGNTIALYGCPYFAEMGLYKVKQMRPGDLDVYTYGDSGLRVAVEFTGSPNRKKKDSDVYFAFDNPKLKMITEGAWEIDIYPHLPHEYNPSDVLFRFFIEYEGERVQGNVVSVDDFYFLYMHRKTTPIKESTDFRYSPDAPASCYQAQSILRPSSKIEKKIAWFFQSNRVFYSDNEVGEIVRAYLASFPRR